MGQAGPGQAFLPGIESHRLTDAHGLTQSLLAHAAGAPLCSEFLAHLHRNVHALAREVSVRAVTVQYLGFVPGLHGGAAQPHLLRRLGHGPQRLQQIQPRGSSLAEAHRLGCHHLVAQLQFITALELDGAVFMHEHAVTGRDAHRAAIGRLHLVQRLVQRMADDGLDGLEANVVCVHTEAEHFAQIGALHLGHAVGVFHSTVLLQRCVDEGADAHHARQPTTGPHEHVVITVHAHDDDAVIAQLVHIEIIPAHTLADAGAQRGDEGEDLVAGEQLLVARLLDVEDLAAQRQDGLELPVTALLGAAAGGVALHDVDLAHRRVFFLAISQLAGQAHAVEHALAARHLARLARSLAGLGRLDDLAANDLGVRGVLQQVVRQRLADHVFHGAAHLAADQLVLGLAAELGLGHLHAEHAAQAFAHVVTADLDLGFLGQFVVVDVLVDHARHGRAQPRQVGAPVTLGDVVGEAQHALAVAVVPLHRHVGGDGGALVTELLAHGAEDGGMQHLLAGVDELHKTLDAAGEGEGVFLVVALVDQADLDAVVQEAQLAQLLGNDVVVKVDLREDFQIGQKVHLGAALVGVTRDAHGADLEAVALLQKTVLRHTLAELDEVHLAIAPHGQAQPLGQRVHAAHAHAMQAA